MRFSRLWALIIKEFLAVWRDKKSRMVLIMPPLVQLIVFAMAATLDVENVSIGILNRDNGKQGYELVQLFRGAPTFTHITYLNSVEEIEPYIDNQKGLMVVSLDEQFSRNIEANKEASVQLILDGRKSNATQIVAGYASTIVRRFNENFTKKNEIPQQNAALITRNWYNPNLIYPWYNIPCLCGVLTMLEALIITALSVARERELGTFDQLLVSPLSPLEILIGKSIPAIVISMLAGSLIVFVGVHVYGIPFTGSLLTLYASMFVFVCSIVGIGLFISAISSTQQQAILGSFVFMSPSVSLSGFATPVENMPGWLQPWTNLIPLRHFLVVTKGVFLKAMPFEMVMENTWPLALIAVFTLSAAAWFFRHRLE